MKRVIKQKNLTSEDEANGQIKRKATGVTLENSCETVFSESRQNNITTAADLRSQYSFRP
jgi:hypothetical protein